MQLQKKWYGWLPRIWRNRKDFRKGWYRGKKSVGARFTAGMAGFLGAGIFRATRTRRWGYWSMSPHPWISITGLAVRDIPPVWYTAFAKGSGFPCWFLVIPQELARKKRVLSCIPMQNLTHGIKRTVFALRESVPDGTIETGLPWHTQGCGLEKELRDRSFYLLFRMGFLLRRGIGGKQG